MWCVPHWGLSNLVSNSMSVMRRIRHPKLGVLSSSVENSPPVRWGQSTLLDVFWRCALTNRAYAICESSGCFIFSAQVEHFLGWCNILHYSFISKLRNYLYQAWIFGENGLSSGKWTHNTWHSLAGPVNGHSVTWAHSARIQVCILFCVRFKI